MGRLSVGGIGRVRCSLVLSWLGCLLNSVLGSTEFRDARQMLLFTARNKVFVFHKTQSIEVMDDADLCTVKKKFSSALPVYHPPLS